MEPTQETASEHYNASGKRTFLFSRITVMVAMIVLVLTLGINIVVLTSTHNNTIKSNAYSPANPEKNLPSLPAGCSYQQAKKGLAVVCPTATPTPIATVPINVTLPKLPPQCTLETSQSGSIIHCSTPQTSIPTVPVTLPTNCVTTPQATIAACKDTEGKFIAVPLPALPGGCSYTLQSTKDYVACEAR